LSKPLGAVSRRWKDNIKMDIMKQFLRMSVWLNWVRFQVLMAMSKTAVFWDVVPCGLVDIN
jgi:hypothetical protein